MKATDLQFRVTTTTGKMLVKQRYYDDTYLLGDGSPLLFILDAALIEYPSGGVRLRTKRDVLEFPDVPTMLDAVVGGKWEVAPVEDRGWKPKVEDLRT